MWSARWVASNVMHATIGQNNSRSRYLINLYVNKKANNTHNFVAINFTYFGCCTHCHACACVACVRCQRRLIGLRTPLIVAKCLLRAFFLAFRPQISLSLTRAFPHLVACSRSGWLLHDLSLLAHIFLIC